MKVLTFIKNDVCYAAYENSDHVFMYNDKIVVKAGEPMIWTGVHNGNSFCFEGVTLPDDWEGYKYCYDGANWSLNPEWVEPEPEPEV